MARDTKSEIELARVKKRCGFIHSWKPISEMRQDEAMGAILQGLFNDVFVTSVDQYLNAPGMVREYNIHVTDASGAKTNSFNVPVDKDFSTLEQIFKMIDHLDLGQRRLDEALERYTCVPKHGDWVLPAGTAAVYFIAFFVTGIVIGGLFL